MQVYTSQLTLRGMGRRPCTRQSAQWPAQRALVPMDNFTALLKIERTNKATASMTNPTSSCMPTGQRWRHSGSTSSLEIMAMPGNTG